MLFIKHSNNMMVSCLMSFQPVTTLSYRMMPDAMYVCMHTFVT